MCIRDSLYDFGIFIELSPDEEEKMMLENNIQMALQQKTIELEDAIDIRDIKNIKLANQFLKIRRKKKEFKDRQLQMENIQAQSQSNTQAAQAAAQVELQKEQALMQGKNKLTVIKELKGKGLSKKEMLKLAPFKIFDGDRPSNTIMIKQLTPYNLGALIALYEHKIFVQGIVWNIFSFDQWGVELGKELADKIYDDISKNTFKDYDPSTKQLIKIYLKTKKN